MFALSNVFVSMSYIASICRFQDVIETAYTLYVFFVLTSIFHLLFITVDRLIAVLQPLKQNILVKKKVLYIFSNLVDIGIGNKCVVTNNR